MLGLGLKPRNVNGASVLPELAAADNIDASARVAGPAPSPGLGLAKPAAIQEALPPQESPAAPIQMDQPPPLTSAPPQQQPEKFYDFDNNPVGTIGRMLGQFAAGYRGDPNTPLAQFDRNKLEQQAAEYKTAELGINVIEKYSKILDAAPPDQKGAIVQDAHNRFSKAVGQDLSPLLSAIANGQIKNAAAKFEALKPFLNPAMAGLVAASPDLVNVFSEALIKLQAGSKSPAQIAEEAAATAAGNKAGGKTPAELAADAAAVAGATQKTPAQLEAEAAATARGTKAGNPDKTPAQIEADAAARARGEAAGSGAGEKMTDTQATSALYADRASQAEKDLTEVAHVGANFWQHLRAGTGGNYATSSEFQRFDQARRNFITAVLRKESGAVISPDEMAEADKLYFPQPGNDEKLIALKAKTRATAIEGLKRAAGPAYGKAKPDPLGIR